MLRRTLPLLLLLPTAVVAQNAPIIKSATVTGGKHDAVNVVVFLNGLVPGHMAVPGDGGAGYSVQAVGDNRVFVVPAVKAGSATTFGFQYERRQSPAAFAFKDTAGEHADLLLGDRPVLRFVNKPRTEADHYLTFKPFHQVFDPKDGKTLLSSGAHPNTKDYLFPHHRGMFFGFNKVSYEQDGKKVDADIWHGTKNVFSTADKTTNSDAGEVFAKQTANISWHGPDGKTFADETRTVTAYNVPGGTMLDWNTELTTKLDKVRLDGDPQHAGFHFRATQEVSKETKDKTYYLRPDGKGKPGEFRNWDAKGKDPKTVNLPWNACSFVTDGKRYTALRVNHPDNPKETRGSERDYGRFGDYFEFDLTPKTPLKLKYRVWVQEGEMTVEQCEAMANGFTKRFHASSPPPPAPHHLPPSG
jgi:Methane oxygenase PmoA